MHFNFKTNIHVKLRCFYETWLKSNTNELELFGTDSTVYRCDRTLHEEVF